MNKKDLVIVALATFCLTATLFMILPSRSAEKDPWADVSGTTPSVPDGVVNMKDIAYEIAHFNENVSNMTRDVNVTNWPPNSRVVTFTLNCTWTNYDYQGAWRGTIWTPKFFVGDYSRLNLFINVMFPIFPGHWSEGNYTVTHAVPGLYWSTVDTIPQIESISGRNVTHQVEWPDNNWLIGNAAYTAPEHLIEVKGDYLEAIVNSFSTDGPGWMMMQLSFFMRNE